MITLSERLKIEPEIWRKMLDNFGADLRVACPGIIQAFDSSRQTVTVRLSIREKININGVLTWEEIPLLVDVPVFMPRAGGYCITFPITAGDECLVIFADNCIDAWWQSGDVQNQVDKRRHDLSDGIALVGLWSQPNKLSNYSTDSAQIRTDAGTVSITIKDDTVTITADKVALSGAYSGLRKLIDERFIDLFNNHTHSGVQTGSGSTGVPATPMAAASHATDKTRAL